MDSLTEVLSDLGIPFRSPGEHHHATSGWLNVDCPWCSPDSGHFRLGINTSKLFCTCWSCGWHNLASSLAELSNQPTAAVAHLLTPLGRPQEAYQGTEAVRGRLVLPGGLVDLLAQHKAYLRNRGFDPEQLVRLWGLRGIGLAANLSWRLWLPITYQGKIVSWTTRSLSDKVERRYVNAKKDQEVLPAKTLLFGEDYVRHCVVIVEGPFDAMRIGPGAVATLGMNVSRPQIAKLAQYPLRVICLDTEPAAQSRADALAEDLSCFPGRTERIVLSAKDPGAASLKEIARLRRLYLD